MADKTDEARRMPCNGSDPCVNIQGTVPLSGNVHMGSETLVTLNKAYQQHLHERWPCEI